MYISKSLTAPNGAVITIHRINVVQVRDDFQVMVNSYVDGENSLIGWQDTYVMPKQDISGDFITAVANWLIGTDGPFSGGTITAE